MGGLSCCLSWDGELCSQQGRMWWWFSMPGICTCSLGRRSGGVEAARLLNFFTLFPPSCFEAVSHHGNAGRAGRAWRSEGSGESLEPLPGPRAQPQPRGSGLCREAVWNIYLDTCGCSCRYSCVWRELPAFGKGAEWCFCCTTAWPAQEPAWMV